MTGAMGELGRTSSRGRVHGVWSQRELAVDSCSSAYALYDPGRALLASESVHGARLVGGPWVLAIMFVSTEKSWLAIIIFILCHV